MRIEYINDGTGSFQEAHGSDGRLNVSSRQDARIYYNSRDESQAYSLVFDDAACTSGDFNVSLFNNRTDGKHLVLHSVDINADAVVTMKLHIVTGTAGGGAVAATPVNLNRAGTSNTATVTASTVANSDSSPISGLTSAHVLDHVGIAANSHERFKVDDSIRLGQGQGLAVEANTSTAGTRVFGTLFFYFE